MSVLDRLLGKPLSTHDESEHHIGLASGVPVLGLDALSSAAYGPEAALTLLLPLGAWLTVVIVPLLFLFFSRVNRHYRSVGAQLATIEPMAMPERQDPIVVLAAGT
ncbi:MAG TPA: hypothetical protein VF403_12675, partial [Kofleriaceae bacterium]